MHNDNSTKKKSRRNSRKVLIGIAAVILVLCGGYFAFRNLKSEAKQPLLIKYVSKEPADYSVSLIVSDYDASLMGTGLVADSAGFEKDSAISAGASLVYNVTDRTAVYSNNAFKKMYPASVTKLTTLLVALKYGNLDDYVTVTDEMLSNLEYGSSLCGLKPGDTMSMNDLLYGLMLPSGNDAACAIAYHIAGSETGFADMMNKEVQSLGAVGTHYVNPHGLHSESHFTTAYDIYLVFNELLKYDKFYDIIETQQYTATYTNAAGETIQNTWNRGIWYFNGLAATPAGITPDGGKTGTTPEAKYCLSLLSSDNNGDKYISIVLHAESRALLYENMTNLLSKIDN